MDEALTRTTHLRIAAHQGDDVASTSLEEAVRELAGTVVYSKLDAFVLPLVIAGANILHATDLNSVFPQACEALGLAFAEIRRVLEPAEVPVQLAKKSVST